MRLIYILKYLKYERSSVTILSHAYLKVRKKVSLMNETMNDLVNEGQEIQSIKDKGILPKIVSFCYSTLYPEANYALYHILRAWEAAGCTLPSLNTDFRTGQCRYFFQVGMNLSIEVRLGMPLALVESRDTQKGLCSYVSKVLYSLSGFMQHAQYQNILPLMWKTL